MGSSFLNPRVWYGITFIAICIAPYIKIYTTLVGTHATIKLYEGFYEVVKLYRINVTI
jgi:hypothetical protein